MLQPNLLSSVKLTENFEHTDDSLSHTGLWSDFAF